MGEGDVRVSDLERFLRAQAPMFDSVLDELCQGRKRGHWMWFVFPQLKGLGHSDLAQFYGISSLEEARAYLMHPALGPRLLECTRLILEVQGRSLAEILGFPDDLKFRSSMTLFAKASAEHAIFLEALEKYCDGELDARTLGLLSAAD